jgi:membrane protein DedA with SNARE-associated domain
MRAPVEAREPRPNRNGRLPSAAFKCYKFHMTEFASQLVAWATDIISTLGYVGVAFLIALETVIPPIPSEVVLPLAGSLSAAGQFEFYLVVIAATIGSLAGSSLLYFAGRWAGETRLEQWIARYGKWVMVSQEDFDRSQAWFRKYGSAAVLIARVVPGLRSIISVPAGLTAMPFGRYALYTVLGSAVWNIMLVSAGYFLGHNWEIVETVLDPVSPVIYAGIILTVALFVGKRAWDRFRSPQEAAVRVREDEE